MIHKLAAVIGSVHAMTTVLAFDPSLVKTGWAVVQSGDVIHLGKIRSNSDRSDVERHDAIIAQCAALYWGMFDEFRDDLTVVVEWPLAAQPGYQKGRTRGIAKYGAIVGALYEHLSTVHGKVMRVSSDEWNSGRVSKTDNKRNAAMRFPLYTSTYGKRGDSGGDVSDACLLAAYVDEQLRLADRVVDAGDQRGAA